MMMMTMDHVDIGSLLQRERETETETDRQTDRDTERQRQRAKWCQ